MKHFIILTILILTFWMNIFPEIIYLSIAARISSNKVYESFLSDGPLPDENMIILPIPRVFDHFRYHHDSATVAVSFFTLLMIRLEKLYYSLSIWLCWKRFHRLLCSIY